MAGGSVPRQLEVPPFDEEAERGLLGCAITNPTSVIDLAVERGIVTESFYLSAHRHVWDALVEMYSANMSIDGVMLSNRLKDKGLFEEVGGMANLQAMVAAAPVTVYVESYLQVVREKALLRAVIRCAREAVDRCYDPDKEVSLAISEAQTAFLALDDSGRKSWHPWNLLVDDAVRHINLLADSNQTLIGLSSGYRDLDRLLQGLKPAEMIVLAARPSMGKTSLALNIAENIAMGEGTSDKQVKSVAVFSLEMSAEALVQRMICCRARVSATRITGGHLARELHARLMHAAEELKRAPIFIDDTGGLDVMEMRARARRLKHRHPDLGLIVVDYLQISHCARQSRDGWQREVAGISGELKSMAKELGLPVLVLSQLSRDAEKRDRTSGVPKLSDLRDSGAIEQDADVVLLLRRPCRYPGDEDFDKPDLAVVDVAKNRNGATGKVRLTFLDEITRFENRLSHDMDPPSHPGAGV